jgi:hypothetical protein
MKPLQSIKLRYMYLTAEVTVAVFGLSIRNYFCGVCCLRFALSALLSCPLV